MKTYFAIYRMGSDPNMENPNMEDITSELSLSLIQKGFESFKKALEWLQEQKLRGEFVILPYIWISTFSAERYKK